MRYRKINHLIFMQLTLALCFLEFDRTYAVTEHDLVFSYFSEKLFAFASSFSHFGPHKSKFLPLCVNLI